MIEVPVKEIYSTYYLLILAKLGCSQKQLMQQNTDQSLNVSAPRVNAWNTEGLCEPYVSRTSCVLRSEDHELNTLLP